MKIIPNKLQPYATNIHSFAMWVGATLITYGITALLISVAVVTLKINELPNFFRYIPFSMLVALFCGLAVVFVTSYELYYKFNKDNPPPED